VSEHLSTAETVRLLRAALRREFPDVKFSVRVHCYDGGASLSVRWAGGPQRGEVDRVVQPFAGAEYDAMTEAKRPRAAWLRPDGSASAQEAQGASEVRFGTDYVFTERWTA
jgi:hypothetical protein